MKLFNVQSNINTTKHAKGPSKNVNIFMSVQTVHFFRPPSPSPPSVQTNIFGFQNMGFTQNIYCAITKQKLTLILSLCNM